MTLAGHELLICKQKFKRFPT